MNCSRSQNTLSGELLPTYAPSFDAEPRVPLPPSNPLPRFRGFSATQHPAGKTLIILLCCLTANVVTAAEGYLAAGLSAVSIPMTSQLNQRDDTLVTSDTKNVLAAEPDILCMALFRALSVRRIGNPFGVRTHAALHPMRRCSDTRTARSTFAHSSRNFPESGVSQPVKRRTNQNLKSG